MVRKLLDTEGSIFAAAQSSDSGILVIWYSANGFFPHLSTLSSSIYVGRHEPDTAKLGGAKQQRACQ